MSDSNIRKSAAVTIRMLVMPMNISEWMFLAISSSAQSMGMVIDSPPRISPRA